jgi:hypothetical protein
MKAAVIIILLGGVFFTIWMLLATINYFFGERIKEMHQERKNMKLANLLQRKLDRIRALKLIELNRVEDVEVEEVGIKVWDLVDKAGKREPRQFVFEISNLPLAE